MKSSSTVVRCGGMRQMRNSTSPRSMRCHGWILRTPMPGAMVSRCAPLSRLGRAASFPAGFAPGFCPPAELQALAEAAAAGVTVVQSTRAGSGRTFRGEKLRQAGFLIADNLNPQKARILLALALTVSDDPAAIARMFQTY